MLNRKNAPPFHLVEKLSFPEYKKTELNNRAHLYSLTGGTQEVIRLDLVFNAGLSQQKSIGISSFTSSMLSEGTRNHTAKELSEKLDYYGSYFQTRSQSDDSIASLYCLEKHLKNCLPLFIEAITSSIFPGKELEIQKKNSIQKLLVNEKKNNYLCRKSFYQNVFGKSHPYAAFSSKEDIIKVNTEDLVSFHENNYKQGFKYALLSGQFSEQSQSIIIDHLNDSGLQLNQSIATNHSIDTSFGKHHIEKAESVQSAIRIGKTIIDRKHPDFRKLQFLNLIFGGYFGSRLMKNIREEKGLTYGIYSVLEPYKHSAVWYIDSEINNKNREKGIEEIYKELAILRDQKIPMDEFETARNYYLGSFLRSLDGPFSLIDRLKVIIDNELSDNYYPEFVATLNQTNPEELQGLANKYLNTENIVEVIVGKK